MNDRVLNLQEMILIDYYANKEDRHKDQKSLLDIVSHHFIYISFVTSWRKQTYFVTSTSKVAHLHIDL